MTEVPLVVYIDGVRKVVGTAEVDAFNTIYAKINEEGAACLGVDCGEFSIGWTPPSVDEPESASPLSVGLAPTIDADRLRHTFSASAVEIATSSETYDDDVC